MEVNRYTIEPGADLVRADLTGARVNSDTTWPEGFDPVGAGVIFED